VFESDPAMITGEDLAQSEPSSGGPRRTRRRPRRRGRITAVIIAVVLIPFLVLGTSVAWFLWQLDTHGSPGKAVPVSVQPGWGVPRIGEELHRDHVIGSSLVFNIYARFNGDNSFQAGTYDLHTGMGVRDAVAALKRGPQINYEVLKVPPGLWLKQVAARVGKMPGRSAQAFLQGARNNSVRSKFEPAAVSNLEGLVRPDTYKISNSQDEISILQTLVTTFDIRATKLGLATANVDGNGPYQIVTVASLIEAEAKVPQDRPLIASVIYNRLKANMPLQIDSTVIYARGKSADRSLSTRDLQIKSPFNTYLHTGLPPTPIGSVSDASLLAAMHPAHTDYLYYVLAGKDGHHAFSSTYQQQQQNIAAAQKAGLL
jgi:UPF0755 protein